MEEDKNVLPQIMGILVKNELSALETIKILEETKKIFLERSWHINSNKKAD